MIAIFGGTFDPIHNGHLYIAGAAATAFSLKEVIFVPGKEPPHRDNPCASPQDRAQMVKCAIAKHPIYKFSDVELERPGPSYTIDTIKTLKKFYPKDDVALILGADAYADFTHWLHWEEILEYGKLIVINRDQAKNPTTSNQRINPDAVLSLQIDPCPISATQIRHCVEHNEPIDSLVPAAVKDYIEAHQLYR